MGTILRIGLGRDKHGKILDRNTVWLNLNNIEQWKNAVREWSDKRNSNKPIFISRNGKTYKEINGVQLLEYKNKLK